MPKDKEQPKRQRRCVIAVLLVVVITIGWIFRYCTVNRFFRHTSFCTQSIRLVTLSSLVKTLLWMIQPLDMLLL